MHGAWPKMAVDRTRLIPLTQGKFAIVDAEDYDRLSRYKWCAVKAGGTFYAGRKKNGIFVRMHREILCVPKGIICDHKDRNGLNNRKSNLRFCTRAQNQYNSNKRPGCSSKYKGVNWDKMKKKWRTRIGFERHRLHLGLFEDPIDAVVTYDRKAIELFGEFAYLNFPQLVEFRKFVDKLFPAA